MQVHEIVTEPLRLTGLSRQECRERALALLAMVGLAAEHGTRYEGASRGRTGRSAGPAPQPSRRARRDSQSDESAGGLRLPSTLPPRDGSLPKRAADPAPRRRSRRRLSPRFVIVAAVRATTRDGERTSIHRPCKAATKRALSPCAFSVLTTRMSLNRFQKFVISQNVHSSRCRHNAYPSTPATKLKT